MQARHGGIVGPAGSTLADGKPASLVDERTFRRGVAEESRMNDELYEILEKRVAAMEELIATCSVRNLLRLRRRLRDSVKGYGWAGPTWWDQRAQAVSDEWHMRP